MSKTAETLLAKVLPLFCSSKSTFQENHVAFLPFPASSFQLCKHTTSVLNIKKNRQKNPDIDRSHTSHYSQRLRCPIISTSPKGRQRRTRLSLSTAGEGESGENPGLGAQPFLHLLSTENRFCLPFFPVPHQASSPPTKECLTQRGRIDSCLLRAG